LPKIRKIETGRKNRFHATMKSIRHKSRRTGATLQFDFSAEDFASGSAVIDVNPPVGDPVAIDFDLDHLR
jgi:hypothetical protein